MFGVTITWIGLRFTSTLHFNNREHGLVSYYHIIFNDQKKFSPKPFLYSKHETLFNYDLIINDMLETEKL